MHLAKLILLSVIAVCLASADAHAVANSLLMAPSATPFQFLGQSVADAGDVNGDGYPDVIVGAPLYNGAQGRAYVYFGGPGADEVADWTLTGPSASNFGASVAGAGDVNNDGYDDIIVGALGFDSTNPGGGFISRGAAFVYLGGASPDAVADVTLEGTLAYDKLGFSVAGVGDANGDGYDDVIVGATQRIPGGGGGLGEAYLLYGGAPMDSIVDFTFTGFNIDSEFGAAVAGAGDVNDDGYNDVVVGAPDSDVNGGNSGEAAVFLCGPVIDSFPDMYFAGPSSADFLGTSVGGGVDVNGDGVSDVIVGATGAGASSRGEVYVYYGAGGGGFIDNSVDLTLAPDGTGTFSFGSSVSGGDLNRDGYGDVVVGDPFADVDGVTVGRAHVFFGGAVPDLVADVTFSGEVASDEFGGGIAVLGDLTADGFNDLVVGAERNDTGGSESGRAYVYDFSRYVITSPNGGETWPVGSTQSITWLGEDPADLWLSIDGGFSFQLVHAGVGGAALNAIPLLVPHVPTKFAHMKVTPSDDALFGEDRSDSLFTIESSVALLTFTVAARPGGGAELAWASEPAMGPQGIAGYRLYRNGRQIGPGTITATTYFDANGTQGSNYRLAAVNGLGEELQLGEAMLPPNAPLAAWPMPYRNGTLNVSFAAGNAFGGGAGQVDVSLYDAAGRRVRTLASGVFAPGFHTTTWDGRDGEGRLAPAGIYFLNLQVEGQTRQMKVVVAP